MAPGGQPHQRRPRGYPLRVVVGDEGGRPVPAGGLGAWLARVAPARARGIISVALVSDAAVRTLNRRYRHKDVPTDVLSFSSASRRSGPAAEPPDSSLRLPFLGDIVIARGVARRQARAAGHSERTELRVLALHGLLHLLGYDHERDGGRMARLERRLRRKGGLTEGLVERARGQRGRASERGWGPARRKK